MVRDAVAARRPVCQFLEIVAGSCQLVDLQIHTSLNRDNCMTLCLMAVCYTIGCVL